MQQFQPFRRCLHSQLGHARDVAARPIKAGDEAKLDRVAAHFKDDRNGVVAAFAASAAGVVVATMTVT